MRVCKEWAAAKSITTTENCVQSSVIRANQNLNQTWRCINTEWRHLPRFGMPLIVEVVPFAWFSACNFSLVQSASQLSVAWRTTDWALFNWWWAPRDEQKAVPYIQCAYVITNHPYAHTQMLDFAVPDWFVLCQQILLSLVFECHHYDCHGQWTPQYPSGCIFSLNLVCFCLQ